MQACTPQVVNVTGYSVTKDVRSLVRARANASCAAKVLLPTPPLPESTRILCLTERIRCSMATRSGSGPLGAVAQGLLVGAALTCSCLPSSLALCAWAVCGGKEEVQSNRVLSEQSTACLKTCFTREGALTAATSTPELALELGLNKLSCKSSGQQAAVAYDKLTFWGVFRHRANRSARCHPPCVAFLLTS